MIQNRFFLAAVLTAALPYIQDFNGSTVLVKVGGSVMEN